ncbi:MAG: PAS-domain containing protein [Proteobacteria bacterium]|nr:PAS-domain containing protein [Pseudomonadota bacterium]
MKLAHAQNVACEIVGKTVGETGADLAATVLAALDGLRTAITLYDSSERLIYANQHFNYLFRSLPHHDALLGLSYDELIRLEIAGHEVSECELAAGDDLFIARRRKQLHAADYKPLDVRTADGRVVEIKVRSAANGGWILLWTDVTQARQMTMRLEDTIELSADAFAFWDKSDRLLLCNTEFAELHGSGSPDELAGKNFTDLLRQAVARDRFATDGHSQSWMDQRIDAHQAPAGALTVTTSNGEAFLVRERATRGGGSVSVFTDVTDRQRAENALNEQTRALKQTKRQLVLSRGEQRKQQSYLADLARRLDAAESEADTTKTTLLRTMSHELKTPLNAILGFADLLRSAPDRFKPEQIAEYTGFIHLAGGNLLRLINQILDLTKLAAKRYPLRRADVDVRAVFNAMFDAYAHRAETRNVAVTLEHCEDDIVAHADENALIAMVGHLVENAVNFTQPGGEVRLSAWRDEDFVQIRVGDNGPGVARADIPRILEPFEQINRGSLEHASGAGLGLPLVKALAELHGGSLAIESELGEGFTATLEIPAASGNR